MAEYNFNNILAELRKGADIDDVMKSFTTQVNAALEQRKNDKQYLDKQYEVLAADWNNTVRVYVSANGLPRGIQKQEQLFVDSETIAYLFETFMGIVLAFAQIAEIAKATPKPGPTTKWNVNQTPPASSNTNIEWADIFQQFFKDNDLM
jgi:hypothetical protein